MSQVVNRVSKSSANWQKLAQQLAKQNDVNVNRLKIHRNIECFRISMNRDERIHKLREIPHGFVPKFKYYFKRYWYIAIPVHCASSVLWFGLLYCSIKGGVDIVTLLQSLHFPDSIIEKVKSTPEDAGVFVIALLLYKMATPLRYLTTIAGVRALKNVSS